MTTLLFLHVLVAMVLVGALIATAGLAFVARRRDDARGVLASELGRRGAVASLVATIVTIGLGEGLAADEGAGGSWLDASRGLAVFGLLLGGGMLAVLAALARSRARFRGPAAATALVLVLIGLATAFVMAAKPS